MLRSISSRVLGLGGMLALVLCPAERALAQLDQNCTVSVLNRSVLVKPDGSWVLPNIPANFGLVRARATCLVNGKTVSGESDLFSVPANGVVNLPPIIRFSTTAPTPIPINLSVAAPASGITQAGATLQLSVTARYADGTTKDVTAGSNGTKYTISNPAIALVSADGLVQSLTSGAVLVQATLEGTSGLFAMQLTLTTVDTDGDGIPDAWEVAHGLNPNSPTDAFEDPDRDDLSNLDEFRNGTDPRKADSDGDGLPDGLEVAESTSPLDSSSYDLSQALASISAAPANFTLSVSSLLLEATQQLVVTGTLKDLKGTQIDLTTGRGTTYSSSNLSICSFGSTPGLVFGGSPGSCVITVRQGPLSATVPGTVKAFTPGEVGTLSVPGSVAVDVGGAFAYVAAGTNGLVVVDVTDRTKPQTRSTLAGLGNAQGVRVYGQYVFIADSIGFLRVVDVSNPGAPQMVAAIPVPGQPVHVAARDNLAVVAAQMGGLTLFDVTNPAIPTLLVTRTVPGAALGVDVDRQRGLAAVAMGTAGLQLVDISNPVAPTLLGRLGGGDVRRVLLRYPAALLSDVQRSVTAVNITNPNQPVITASTPANLGGAPVDLAAFASLAITADISFGRAIPVLNVSNPLLPQSVAFWTPGSAGFGSSIAMDVSFGYVIFPGTLRIYQYQNISDTAGVPPAVAIVAPVGGSTVVENEVVTAKALATDDVFVAGVNFVSNGVLASSQTSPPYQATFTAPAGVSGFDITATAVDLGGNSSSASVRVNVIPDPLTTVAGRVVDDQGAPLAGSAVSCLTRAGVSLADGSFLIFGVPTTQPTFTCSASIVSAQGTSLVGKSSPLSPLRGGATAAGDILLGPAPIVSSILPRAFDARLPPASLQIAGANLSGSSFAAAPAATAVGLSFGTPQVNASGTLATVPITVLATAHGAFVLVGTNAFGSGPTAPTAGNSFSVVNAQDDGDRDGDSYPDGIELLYGSDSLDSLSVPNLTSRGDLVSGAFSVNNTTLPTTVEHSAVQWVSVINTTLPSSVEHSAVQWVSVLNTTLPSSVDHSAVQWFSVLNNAMPPSLSVTVSSTAFSVQNSPPPPPLATPPSTNGAPLVPAPAAPPALSVVSGSALASGRVVAGQTLTVSAIGVDPTATTSVSYVVNDATLATTSSPAEALLLTVPAGVSELRLVVRATQRDGTIVSPPQVTLAVDSDGGRAVSGRVVDSNGVPMAGATVEVMSQGLNAEFYKSATPLSGLPSLVGATPVKTTRVTAINTRNPSGVFGFDPFGVGLAPDYAARFTGWLAVSATGSHTFVLGAHEGAKLVVGGVTVVDLSTPAATGFQERSGTIDLQPGIVPVEVTFYESTGSPELQLSVVPPGGLRQVVPPSSLAAGGGAFTVVTDSVGRFTIRDVPTVLDEVSVRVSATGVVVPVIATVPGGVPATSTLVDVGDVVVGAP